MALADACWHYPPVAERLSIRPEQPGDYDAVDGVVRAAFAHHPDEVSLLVKRIRASANYVPGSALLAEDESGVIGHVMLSFIAIEGGSLARAAGLDPDVGSARPPARRGRLAADPRPARPRRGRRRACSAGRRDPGLLPALRLRACVGFVARHASIPDDAFMAKRLPGFAAELLAPLSIQRRSTTSRTDVPLVRDLTACRSGTRSRSAGSKEVRCRRTWTGSRPCSRTASPAARRSATWRRSRTRTPAPRSRASSRTRSTAAA